MTRLKNLFSLQGKTALVAGGAGLLGGEIADALAEQGANLVIASRDIRKCKKKCEQLLLDFPNIAKALSIDLTKPSTIEKCVSDSEMLWKSGYISYMCMVR